MESAGLEDPTYRLALFATTWSLPSIFKIDYSKNSYFCQICPKLI